MDKKNLRNIHNIRFMLEIIRANVTVMVSDLDRAIEFYTERLGLQLVRRYNNHWADIEGPGITIGLHPTRKIINPGDNMQIGIRVADVQHAQSLLQNSGIKFNATADQVRMVHFNDPDGNTLYLIQT